LITRMKLLSQKCTEQHISKKKKRIKGVNIIRDCFAVFWYTLLQNSILFF
jgi:hypothetical protein